MNPDTPNYGLKIIPIDDLRQAFIQFNTYTEGYVILKVMNEEDKEVRILLNERLSKGVHNVPFNFGNLTGNYIIRLAVNMQEAIDIENQTIQID